MLEIIPENRGYFPKYHVGSGTKLFAIIVIDSKLSKRGKKRCHKVHKEEVSQKASRTRKWSLNVSTKGFQNNQDEGGNF
jgi:hypothetical protein